MSLRPPTPSTTSRTAVRALLVAVPIACLGAALPLAGCGDDRTDTPKASTGDRAGGFPASASRSPRSRVVLREGRSACTHRRPNEIEASYLAEATRNARLAERRFLRNVRRDTYPRATAARVAARVYAMSLPRTERRDGYLGCAQELLKSSSSKPAPASGGRS